MNMAVRRFFQSTPVLRDLYRTARELYNRRRHTKTAKNYFTNFDQYKGALESEDGRTVDIRTEDGLLLTIRRNHSDASVLGEIFLDNCYVRGLRLPERPIVVDIGGYIGDFAVYAAKRLNARRVVVCEPSPRNFALLKRNVENNHFEDRIEAVNKAVTDGQDVMLDIDAPDRGQFRVSAYGSNDVVRKSVPGITLASLAREHGLEGIDLLKIDCEGGEYSILSSTPTAVFRNIRNIVFECHEIDGFQAKLEAVKDKLTEEGYSLVTRGSLISASRL